MPVVGTNMAPVMETARNISKAAQEGVDTTKRALKQAGEAVVEAYDHTVKNVIDSYDDTVMTVKKYPMRSVALAAGIGLGVGILGGVLIGRALYLRKPLLHFFK